MRVNLLGHHFKFSEFDRTEEAMGVSCFHGNLEAIQELGVTKLCK